MAEFLFNDVIKSQNGEFFLRTTSNQSSLEIASSFFRNGTLLTASFKTGNREWSAEQLREKTRQFHLQKKHEISILLELAEKLKDSVQPEAKLLLGQAFANRNMFEEAIAEFEEAVALDPNGCQFFKELGKAYLAVERFDDAVAAFSQAITIAPEYADFHNYLGSAYLSRQQCRKAVEEFEIAVRLNPYYAEAYYNLALAYVLNGITKEEFALSVESQLKVEGCLEKAGRIDPKFKSSAVEEGLENFRLKNFEAAYQVLRSALEETPKTLDTSFILDFYLRVIYGGKKLKGTIIQQHIRRLRGLIVKFPNFADLYNHLGVAYLILSKQINRRAIQQFSKAAAVNPEFQRAQKNRKLASYDQKGIDLLFEAILR